MLYWPTSGVYSNCLDGLAPVDKSSHLHSSAPVQSIAV